MSELKKGDVVCVKEIKRVKIPPLAKLEIVSVYENSIIVTGAIFLKKNEVFKIGESQMQYEESNRYKLAQAIKKTGLKVSMLSAAASNNTNISHFTNYQAKSRFNERGDISEARLNELLTDLAFAEREVLGVGAKTVDEPNQETIDAINAECDSDVFLTAQDLANSVKEKPTSNKPLFIGAAVVISIVLILLILNNYFQVV